MEPPDDDDFIKFRSARWPELLFYIAVIIVFGTLLVVELLRTYA
jgi:hypothetical protein